MVNKIKKYFNLFHNIRNWREYIFHKGEHKKRYLHFVTKPVAISFSVKGDEYPIFKELFMSDFYQIKKLANSLPPHPVIVDIGANIGLFPVLILSKLKHAAVYAYEPLPSNFKRFSEIVEENRLLKKSIKLFEFAVTGNKEDHIDIYFEQTQDGTAFASVFDSFDQRNTSKITVPCTTLEEIFHNNNLEKIDLLKLDCEGSEFSILYNLDPSLFSRIDQIFVEVHDMDNENYNIKSFSDFLTNKEYIISIKKAGKDSLLWAHK